MGRALKELTDHRNDLHAHMPVFALVFFLRETIEEESSQTDTFSFFEDIRKKSRWMIFG